MRKSVHVCAYVVGYIVICAFVVWCWSSTMAAVLRSGPSSVVYAQEDFIVDGGDLTLPLGEGEGEGELVPVVMFRNPLDVARALDNAPHFAMMVIAGEVTQDQADAIEVRLCPPPTPLERLRRLDAIKDALRGLGLPENDNAMIAVEALKRGGDTPGD